MPVVACVPDHAPDAVHEVAFVELQLSVAEPPLCTVEGDALKLSVGAGLLETVTVAERCRS